MTPTIRMLLAAWAAWAWAAPVRGQFEELVQHLPDEANTLVLFNVEKIVASPLAQKEDWKGHHENVYASGLVMVPSQTRQFAMAWHMDLELMQPQWHAAVMDLKREPSIAKVAAHYGGHADQMDGLEAAVLPNNSYIVKFGDKLAGMMAPANRQMVVRWVQEVASTTPRTPLAGYLAEAEAYADKNGTPIVMALDLEHIFSPKFIRDRLGSMKSLEGRKVDLDQLAAVLGSIRGVTLGVTMKDRAFGGVKVDFDQDVSIMNDFAQPLLLEILANRGAMIEEFKEWKVQVRDKHVLLEGHLGQSGMHRVFSLLDAPPTLHPVEPNGPAPPDAAAQPDSPSQQSNPPDGQGAGGSASGPASQQYFHSITRLLDDLGSQRKSTDFTTTGQISMWFEKYARKIDALPILQVDPDLVDFGAYVADQLRQAESAMRGVAPQAAYRITNKPNAAVYNTAYATGPYGGYAYRYSYDQQASLALEGQQRAQIRTQERIRGYSSANMVMQGLDAATADMRRHMTEKYQVEF